VYCRAILPNAGLGNKLFPWARCRVFSLEHGVDMLNPRWTQLRLGPLLRRDRDTRVYHNLFKAAPPGYVSGARALRLRLARSNQVVEFIGAEDHFRSLTGRHAVLLDELRALTRDCWLQRADRVATVTIGMHVRRGDFAEASGPQDFVLRGAIRTPLEWFVECLALVREMCGFAVPALVVSDAPDSALRRLLQEEAVTRIDTGSAIGDLLVLSKAKLLIASGGSSFSAWAAFLGQMPTLAFPGQSLTWFNIVPTQDQYIGDWSPGQHIPSSLLEPVGAR